MSSSDDLTTTTTNGDVMSWMAWQLTVNAVMSWTTYCFLPAIIIRTENLTRNENEVKHC